MSGQVVLYFEDQADALRFALAAGSVMAGEGAKFTSDLVQETARVTRIRLDAVNAGAAARRSRILCAWHKIGGLRMPLRRLPGCARRTVGGGCPHTSNLLRRFRRS